MKRFKKKWKNCFLKLFNYLFKNTFILICIILFSGPKQFSYRGHHYFFSGHVPELANRKVDWLDGRNICREYCMDLVSMETQEENNIVFKLILQSKYYYQQSLTVKFWILVCSKIINGVILRTTLVNL